MIVMGFMGILHLAFICVLLESLVQVTHRYLNTYYRALHNETAMNQSLRLQHPQ